MRACRTGAHAAQRTGLRLPLTLQLGADPPLQNKFRQLIDLEELLLRTALEPMRLPPVPQRSTNFGALGDAAISTGMGFCSWSGLGCKHARNCPTCKGGGILDLDGGERRFAVAGRLRCLRCR